MLRALHTGAGGVRAGPHCGKPFTPVRVLALNPENISLACSYVFWFRRGQNEQMTHDLLKIRLSHQSSCKHNSRSMFGISNIKSIAIKHHTSCIDLHHIINIYPSLDLSYWKLNFLTPKMSWTGQRKPCGCGKLSHGTRRIFLHMRARTSARTSVNALSLFMCEHSVQARSAGPACGPARPHAPVWMHLYLTIDDFENENMKRHKTDTCEHKVHRVDISK